MYNDEGGNWGGPVKLGVCYGGRGWGGINYNDI